MDWLATILTSKNTAIILLFLLIIVVIIVMVVNLGVKKGWFRFKGKGLEIGKIQSDERAIIQKQWQYSNARINSFVSELLFKNPGLNPDKIKYIASKAEDEIQSFIVQNHLKTDSDYIKIKQVLLLDVWKKRADNEYFFSGEFKDKLNDFVETLIKDLVEIRNENNEENK